MGILILHINIVKFHCKKMTAGLCYVQNTITVVCRYFAMVLQYNSCTGQNKAVVMK